MTDEDNGPDLGLEDDDSLAVMRAVGRMIKVWREGAGLTQTGLGSQIGYCEEMVSAVERGKRVPQPEFLDNTDVALGANGKISAMKEDIATARLPKKVRDLAKLEGEAVELGQYGNHNMDGLLQTEEYARTLYGMRRPAYKEAEIDRLVAARMARKSVFEREPLPMLTFVQEEVTLRRPLGDRMVLRRQLEHLLELGTMRHVGIQVMPTDCQEHAGMGGQLQLLKLRNGSTVGHWEAQLSSRVVTAPKEVQILEMRYGMIRAQALAPRESLAFIERILGET